MSKIPYIKAVNEIPTLFVHDEPFFVYGGELHNSAAASLSHMEENVWPNVRDLHMNTLVVPLYWEAIEAVEGVYDFSLMDGLIYQARAEQMHLVFLWFGLWKNGESMYVPGWMKRDLYTYYRVELANGEKTNTISPLCQAAIEKDAAAFAAVMAHLKDVDEEENTVIFIQVENEIGILGAERDYSVPANKAFAAPMPALLREAYGEASWESAFGVDAPEAFMAYHFAAAVETITRAGQKEYPLPCYANAWLKQYPWYAGSYPSGGPQREMHEVWKMAAPSLFTLAPDIYVPYVADVLDQYGYEGNPLFVPEVRKDAVTASYCLYAFAAKNAIGYSPFGIEELALPPEAIEKPPMDVMIALNIDPSAFDVEGSKEYLKETYRLVEELKPLLLEYRGTDQLKSYVCKSATDYGTFFRLEDYDLSVAYDPRMPRKPLAAGCVFALTPHKFLIVGMRSTLSFRPKPGEVCKVGYLSKEEGNVVSGQWQKERTLNGDEIMSLHLGDMPGCIMVELYKY